MQPLGRTRSLSEELVQLLSEQIRQQAWLPGEKLPTEAEIVRTYGVSRTVVREALSKLQSAGLVETRHGVGTFLLAPPIKLTLQIPEVDADTVLDVMAVLELRISIESEAARLAAARRSEQNLIDLRRTLDAFEKAIQSNGNTIAADIEFHRQVAIATGNRYFTEILAHLGATIIPRLRVQMPALAHSEEVDYLTRVHQDHQDIFDAIERRDPNGAHAAMHMHLTKSRERLRQACVNTDIDQRPPTEP